MEDLYNAAETKVHPQEFAGVQLWGPAGAATWSAPTVDTKRHVLYVTTGNNSADPVTKTSDAILALDLDIGKMLWSRQFTGKDAFNFACLGRASTSCPEANRAGVDFGNIKTSGTYEKNFEAPRIHRIHSCTVDVDIVTRHKYEELIRTPRSVLMPICSEAHAAGSLRSSQPASGSPIPAIFQNPVPCKACSDLGLTRQNFRLTSTYVSGPVGITEGPEISRAGSTAVIS